VANTPPRWKRHEKQPERITSQRANEENKDLFSSSFPLFPSVNIRKIKTAGTNRFTPAAVLDAVTQVNFAPPKFPSRRHDTHGIAPRALSRAAAQRADLDQIRFARRRWREQHPARARVINEKLSRDDL
jgi:hypothetical protein